jgi:Flp pilus assembly protein TadG
MTRAKDERGQAMVEFVLVLPLFLGLVFLAIGFGITVNNYLRVTDVARVAARAGAIARFGGQAPCTAAGTAATKAAAGLTFARDPANGNPTPYCVCASGPSCTPGTAMTVTVTINSQNALTTIPFLSLALPKTLTSKATVLLQ